MILYPRLERSATLVAEAGQLGAMSIEQCRARRSTTHSAAIYTATGGTRATVTHLEKISAALTDIALKHGYPKGRGRNTGVDADWSEWLHPSLNTSPHEAAFDSMWHFFTVALVPDLVRWRWGESDPEEGSDRWVTIRRRGRNAFGRLWWRCEILKDDAAPAPFLLVKALGEDELVQIMERPSFAGHRVLSRTTAAGLLAVHKKHEKLNRSAILREYQKRMLRVGAFTDFQALGEEPTKDLSKEMFDRTLSAMKVQGATIRKKKS